MIQRKQTLFLLIALGLLISMLFMPLVTTTITPTSNEITNLDGSVTKITAISANNIVLNPWGLYYDTQKEVDFIYFTIMLFISILLVFMTIFLYKKRLLQIKLCYIIWLFLIGLLIFEGIYLYRLIELLSKSQNLSIASNYSVSMLFPLVSAILVLLAYKGIIKDEALVRSLDRLR